MLSLGIICYQGHSSAAGLVRDGVVLGAVAEERFSRKKCDDSFPQQSIEFLLKEFGLNFETIDHVGIGWSPKITFLGQLKNLHRNSLRFVMEKRNGGIHRSRISKFFLISNLKNEIRKRYDYRGKISYVEHHLSHAISAFIQSQQKDCVVMVADGMGEFTSTTIYEFSGKDYKILYRDHFPNSLGIFYSAATQFLGFTPDSDEYKVMGMAAYSESERFHERLSLLYEFKNGHVNLNLNYFEIHKRGNQFFSKKYAELFSDVKTEKDKTDFAFSLQWHFNKIVLQILKEVRPQITSRHFATSGGVFLNCLLNQALRASEMFESYTFFPVADDNGVAVGAAQFMQFSEGKWPMQEISHLYLGPELDEVDETLLKKFHYKKISHVKEVAELLADGKVIAWAQGKMEFGHRSLGNRSILGNPKQKEMKDIINHKVKLREAFRPFAPSILEEKLSEFFSIDQKFGTRYPFMIETVNAKESAKTMAPAIVHEDGTSRVQTVSRRENEKYYQLIEEFYHLTGCPMVLNTSFNINGMPIVRNVREALDCFEQTQIDYLVLNDYLIWK
jgi:carbamoyltransferase